MKTAVVLFAHGARDPRWAAPLVRVAEAVEAAGGRAALAFLEFLAPDLENCCQGLVLEGFRRIHVLPMFIAAGGHLQRDLPPRLAALRERYPEVEWHLAGAVGESELVLAAMANEALTLLRA